MQYECVIGMEVHVELQTASKMFCACSADHFQVPANQHICPVCTAQPGSLPVINGRAIELTVMTGKALNCQIQPHNVFARKNYVYPDLPKGYQISQYELPLCLDGFLEVEEAPKRIGIVRVHLEEDTGKLVHEGGASLVDLNRAGVPLMEIVSDSSIRSADEAYAYLVKIRQLVRYLGASSGDMEKGAMRCEANISVRPQGAEEYGTKVEVKNLNSFRSVRNAIDYEMRRQIQLLEDGGQVEQVTMGWDEQAAVTRQQRSKESSEDYRYFPEPDLLDIELSPEWIADVNAQLPELPDAKSERFAATYGLAAPDIALLVDDGAVADYFEKAAQNADPKQVSNWISRDLFSRLKDSEEDIAAIRVKPEALAELIGLVQEGAINQKAALQILDAMWEEGGSPRQIVDRLGLGQISDTAELDAIVAQTIEENAAMVDKIKGGDAKPLNALMGQVMKATRGKANPQIVRQLLQQQIGSD